MPLVTFRRKNNFSIPHEFGLYVSISSVRSEPICTNLSESESHDFVSITPNSIILKDFPSFSRIANPVVAVQGSIQRNIIVTKRGDFSITIIN